MPQCQKWAKYHNVNGVIRTHQKCHRGVTWYNKDAAKVLQRCNMNPGQNARGQNARK